MTDDAQDLSMARTLRLHVSAQALLYDVQRRVRAGYRWWTCGTVPSAKVLAVVAKLGARYGVFATASVRSRRKTAGLASAVLLVWPMRHDPAGYTTQFGFLLLATSHLDGEVMYDGQQRPVRVDLYADGGGVYHLRPAPGHTLERAQPGYVWHLTPKCQQRMEEQLVAAAGAELSAFQRTVYRYRQLPMTSGYRHQLKAALQSALPTWRRNNRPSVQTYKQQIKRGETGDPFKETLPFVSGFPKLFGDPALTLRTYLASNDKRRRELQQQWAAQAAGDHPVVL